MVRRLVAGLIVVGLAVGIWALWPREDSDTTPTTGPVAAGTTSTTLPTSTITSTTLAATTTTSGGSHVVTTVEEAEAILRELWFGWFEGIYNQDEERIKEVVGTQAMMDSARDAFGSMVFEAAPSPAGVELANTEILRSDELCLALHSTLDVSSFAGSNAVETSVFVLRHDKDRWLLATVWINRGDLWEQDCDSQLEPLS